MLLALYGLVYGGVNDLVLDANDAKDRAAFVINVPVFFYVDANDAKDAAKFTFVAAALHPNDAKDVGHFFIYDRWLLQVLPVLRVRYGCTVDEDFRLLLRFRETVTTATFELTIGELGDVASVAGVIQSDQRSVLFYAAAATGPAAWANVGTGGKGPGNYLMELLVTQTPYSRQIFQLSSFTLGESIPPQVEPVRPYWPPFFPGTPFADDYGGPPPFPLDGEEPERMN